MTVHRDRFVTDHHINRHIRDSSYRFNVIFVMISAVMHLIMMPSAYLHSLSSVYHSNRTYVRSQMEQNIYKCMCLTVCSQIDRIENLIGRFVVGSLQWKHSESLFAKTIWINCCSNIIMCAHQMWDVGVFGLIMFMNLKSLCCFYSANFYTSWRKCEYINDFNNLQRLEGSSQLLKMFQIFSSLYRCSCRINWHHIKGVFANMSANYEYRLIVIIIIFFCCFVVMLGSSTRLPLHHSFGRKKSQFSKH